MTATYTISLTDAERQDLARAFGLLVEKLTNATPILESPLSPPQPSPVVAAAPPAPAIASREAAGRPESAKPIELRDRWGRNRQGKEVPNPEGAEAITVEILRVAQQSKYLRVTWANGSGALVNANCFDEKLRPWISGRLRQKTTLYVLQKGDYLNIVGVRA